MRARKNKLEIKSYQQALAILKGRDKRCLQNHTHLENNHDGTIGVRLWATDVVKYHQDGTITLHTGGYYTVTTKDRINIYCPHGRVGANYLSGSGWSYRRLADQEEYEFENGMSLDADGKPNTRPAVLGALETRLGKELPSLDVAAEVIGGLGLKELKALTRNRHLRPTALRYCNKDFVPLYMNDESVAGIIGERMRA